MSEQNNLQTNKMPERELQINAVVSRVTGVQINFVCGRCGWSGDIDEMKQSRDFASFYRECPNCGEKYD